MGSLLHRMTGDCKKTVRGIVHLSPSIKPEELHCRCCFFAAERKVLSHLWQSFPRQAFGLGRSCLVTAGCRRRPMVVKPTLTFRSGKKIVYGTLPASKSCHWCNATKEEKCASTFHSIWINLSGIVRGCKFKINIHLDCAKLNINSSSGAARVQNP